MWCYVSTRSLPRLSTLSLLSRFLGYSCWDSYVAYLLRNKVTESDYVTTKQIRSKDLCEGDVLRIGWNPDRECKIRYKGDFCFSVISSVHSKLKVGDTFMAMSFSLGNLLQLTNLVQDGGSPCSYVAGTKKGLTILEILSPDTIE